MAWLFNQRWLAEPPSTGSLANQSCMLEPARGIRLSLAIAATVLEVELSTHVAAKCTSTAANLCLLLQTCTSQAAKKILKLKKATTTPPPKKKKAPWGSGVGVGVGRDFFGGKIDSAATKLPPDLADWITFTAAKHRFCSCTKSYKFCRALQK